MIVIPKPIPNRAPTPGGDSPKINKYVRSIHSYFYYLVDSL